MKRYNFNIHNRLNRPVSPCFVMACESDDGEWVRNSDVYDLIKENEVLKTDTLSVEEKCRSHHIQNCHECGNAECCDNQNPLIVMIKELNSSLKVKEEILNSLIFTVIMKNKKIEELEKKIDALELMLRSSENERKLEIEYLIDSNVKVSN